MENGAEFVSHTDGGANKDSAFSDELELQGFLEKLSGQTSESQHTVATGDTDSVNSHAGSGLV